MTPRAQVGVSLSFRQKNNVNAVSRVFRPALKAAFDNVRHKFGAEYQLEAANRAGRSEIRDIIRRNRGPLSLSRQGEGTGRSENESPTRQ